MSTAPSITEVDNFDRIWNIAFAVGVVLGLVLKVVQYRRIAKLLKAGA